MAEKQDKLAGARVLVLEDESLVSMMIEDMLGDLGCVVIGPFARLDDALDALKGDLQIDLALLDVNVAGKQSYPVAEAIQARGAPIVFTTGYDERGLPEKWRSAPALRKPFMLGQMERALNEALA
jgi:CheY-like chemotaxis protein